MKENALNTALRKLIMITVFAEHVALKNVPSAAKTPALNARVTLFSTIIDVSSNARENTSRNTGDVSNALPSA